MADCRGGLGGSAAGVGSDHKATATLTRSGTTGDERETRSVATTDISGEEPKGNGGANRAPSGGTVGPATLSVQINGSENSQPRSQPSHPGFTG